MESNTSSYYRKESNFSFPRKPSMVPSDKGLQWVNVKKAIPTTLGTFRHNQAYLGIIQTYSGIFRTFCNSGIF